MADSGVSHKPALRDRAPFPFRTLLAMLHEARAAFRLAGDTRSLARLLGDMVLFRLLGLGTLPGRNGERSIRLKGGVEFTYRLNRGDYQSIREVWMDEAYRLPFEIHPKVIVDLGANIGMTSLYLVQQHRPSRLIAVEPSGENARLLRKNLARLQVNTEVIEAAVGPVDGTARFESSADSNMGKLGERGQEVVMVSMPSVLSRLPGDASIDLLKMDIEGGEQELLTRNVDWLARIRSIVAEFHPDAVDYPGLIAVLERSGFTYHSPAQTHGLMDSFVRPERDL